MTSDIVSELLIFFQFSTYAYYVRIPCTTSQECDDEDACRDEIISVDGFLWAKEKNLRAYI